MMGLIDMESWEYEHQIEILTVRCNHIEQKEKDMKELAKTFARNMAMMSGQIERMTNEIQQLEKRIEMVESK